MAQWHVKLLNVQPNTSQQCERLPVPVGHTRTTWPFLNTMLQHTCQGMLAVVSAQTPFFRLLSLQSDCQSATAVLSAKQSCVHRHTPGQPAARPAVMPSCWRQWPPLLHPPVGAVHPTLHKHGDACSCTGHGGCATTEVPGA